MDCNAPNRLITLVVSNRLIQAPDKINKKEARLLIVF